MRVHLAAGVVELPTTAFASLTTSVSRGELLDRLGELEHQPVGDGAEGLIPLFIGDYVVTGLVGRGSYGVVVSGFDPLTREQLAIKLLHVDDPLSRHELRNELRYLDGVYHPGLLSAEELIEVDGGDALVMQFVEGVDLRASLSTAAGAAGALAHPERFRRVVLALLDALQALHEAGLIHMDLKPSNILVDADDHVHVLDFGLSRVAADARPENSGTPLYMSPEQLLGYAPTSSVDQYALGIMLFEVLTGRTPFEHVGQDPVFARLYESAPPVQRFRPGLDPAWASVVDALLAAAPEARPSSAELLVLLNAPRRPRATAKFTGRVEQLSRLHAFWRNTRGGIPALVFVQGPPGAGKSELLRRFAREVTTAGDALLAWGRCHERDSTPYRALDSVLGQLGAHLRADTELAARAMKLPGFDQLLGLFPGLAIPGLEPEALASPAHVERALLSLIELVTRRHPLLLIIDDAHAGDADSALLLATLLSSPTLQRILVVVGLRDAEWRSSRFGTTIDSRLQKGLALVTEHLTLSPHDPAEAEESSVPARRVGRDGEDAGETTTQREFLRYLEVAGRALPARVFAAAGAPIPDRASLRAMRARSLVEVRSVGGSRVFVGGHALRRASSARGVGDDRSLYRELARALEDHADDPGAVAEYLAAAGEPSLARPRAIEASDRAEAAGAFLRAAELLALVIDEAVVGDLELHRRRAELLLAAGRSREGAELLLTIARTSASADDRRALQRRAAESLMMAGDVTKGLELLAPIFEALEMPPLQLGVRAATRIGGSFIHAMLRRPTTVSPKRDARAAERAALCWSIGKIVVFAQPMHGLDLILRAIQYGRKSGSRDELAPAMGFLASTLLVQLSVARSVAESWLASVDQWAQEETSLASLSPLYRGLYALSVGDLVSACERSRHALKLLSAASWATWERGIAINCLARALRCQGEYVACAELTRRQRRDAERRDDLYGQIIMSDYEAMPMIAREATHEVRARLEWIRASWYPERYTVQRAYTEIYSAYLELYEGRADAAAARLQADQAAFRGAGGYRIQFGRVDRNLVDARVALARADVDAEALRSLPRLITKLRAEGIAEATGNAELLEAAVLARRGARADACERLWRAVDAFARAKITMEAEAARLRRAELEGDRDGASRARASMRRLGAHNPSRWADVIAPGFTAS